MQVSHAGAGNDYQKDIQFKKLNAAKDAIDVKVLRYGKETLIPNTELLVGDVLLLDTGDKISADGIVFQAYGLVADEAALTGESEQQHKGLEELWCLSGTQVQDCQKQNKPELSLSKQVSIEQNQEYSQLKSHVSEYIMLSE